VYERDNHGLIGSVSTTIFLWDSQVLGIISKALSKKNITWKTTREELKVSTMSEWIGTMLEHYDAFISLLDGLGTLWEIFDIFF
jgi:predicted Rossmann-fold nucleotide-binding protein